MKGLLKFVKWSVIALVVLIIGYVISMSAIGYAPDDSAIARLKPASAAGVTVLVAGATSASGIELVRVLKNRGYTVVAMVRKSSNTATLDALAVDNVLADSMVPDELRTAVAARKFDAVVSLIGTSARDLPGRSNPIQGLLMGPREMDPNKRPDFIGNRNLVDAAKAQGIARFVLVTVIGAGDSAAAVPPGARRGHSTVTPLKTQAEDYLRASGLKFTIVRPGGLGNQPPRDSAVLVEDPKAFSYLARSDLGRLTADALGDPAAIGKTYTAYDPNRRMLWKMFAN